MATDIILAVALILLVIAALWHSQRQGAAILTLARESSERTERMANASLANSRTCAEQLNAAIEKIVVLKGLAPHHAAPEKFAPNGISWPAAEKLEQVLRENTAVPTPEFSLFEAEQAEANAIADEFFRTEAPLPKEAETNDTA